MKLQFPIETERLVMREFMLEDAPNMYRLNSNPIVMQYTGDVPFENLQGAEDLMLNYADYHKFGFGRWTVLRKSDGAFLGWCGLKQRTPDEVDLGYRFLQEEWGKGYATEAALKTMEVGYQYFGLDEVIAQCDHRNIGSKRVMEKCGFTFWKNDPVEECDLVYRITKLEWEAFRKRQTQR